MNANVELRCNPDSAALMDAEGVPLESTVMPRKD